MEQFRAEAVSEPRSDLPTEPQSEPARARSRALSRGKPRVPGYELERLLGVGTYGEVWLARDVRTGVQVAIKFVAHGVGDRWEFLLSEVQQLASLHSDPGIVRLLDVNRHAAPPYYVMSYAEGGSLASLLEQGPLPVERAEAIFRKLVVSLAYVHAKGIRHCDLKPGNVLLTARGEPLLADFGQAHLSTEASPTLGTFFYMPPEQASLARGMPDTRWDVYGLGALMYAMLVGHPPHDTPENRERLRRARGLAAKLEEYRRLLLESEPPREHHRIRGLDRELARIIDRCLELDPGRRFASAEAVQRALEERDRAKRNRPLLLLGGLAPTLLAFLVIAFVWHGIATALEEGRRVAVEQSLDANRTAAGLGARTVAQAVDRRWRILEAVADDPGFVRLVEQASRLSTDRLPDPQLQERLDQLHRAHQPTAQATSWFVTDATGRQIARSPLDPETLGRDYSFRDYFHGLGRDLPSRGMGEQVEPIRAPHRSMVFVSEATHTPMIALSVPVMGRSEPENTPTVLGVLAMTVEIGHFLEIQPENGRTREPPAERPAVDRYLALIDCRPDWTGKSGLVLQHPLLPSVGTESPSRLVHLAEGDVRRLCEQRAFDATEFRDPLDPQSEFWIASARLVVSPRPGSPIDWAVLAAQRREAALEVTGHLEAVLVTRGAIATATLIAVLLFIWVLVYRELTAGR